MCRNPVSICRTIGSKILSLLLALVIVSSIFLAVPLVAQTQPIAISVPIVTGPIAQSNSNSGFLGELVRRVQVLINPSRRNQQGQAVPAGRARGGAGRGKFCPPTPIPVVAIVPSIQATFTGGLTDRLADLAKPETVFGKTTEVNPTFWFYIPYRAAPDLQMASFMLLNEEKHPVFPEPILINFSDTPGMIQFRLPFALEVDRLYNWYFSILCDPLKPSRNSGVRGWIQRVERSAELQHSLQAATSAYQAYAEAGIWFDLVTDLAVQYSKDSENPTYQQGWAGVLEFIQKPELKDAAIVDCCEPAQSELR